jgi:hypothetical protein
VFHCRIHTNFCLNSEHVAILAVLFFFWLFNDSDNDNSNDNCDDDDEHVSSVQFNSIQFNCIHIPLYPQQAR